MHLLARGVREPDPVERLGDARRSGGARRVPVGGVEAAQVRLAREERARTPGPRRARRRAAAPRRRAAACRRRARGRRPRSRATRPSSIRIVVVLPDPFGPRNPNTGAARDGEVDAVDGGLGSEALGEAVRLDREVGHARRPSATRLAAASSRRSAVTAPDEHATVVGEEHAHERRLQQASAVDRLGQAVEHRGCLVEAAPAVAVRPSPLPSRRCRRAASPRRRRRTVALAAGSTTDRGPALADHLGTAACCPARPRRAASASAFHCSSSATVGTGTSCSVTVVPSGGVNSNTDASGASNDTSVNAMLNAGSLGAAGGDGCRERHPVLAVDRDRDLADERVARPAVRARARRPRDRRRARRCRRTPRSTRRASRAPGRAPRRASAAGRRARPRACRPPRRSPARLGLGPERLEGRPVDGDVRRRLLPGVVDPRAALGDDDVALGEAVEHLHARVRPVEVDARACASRSRGR